MSNHSHRNFQGVVQTFFGRIRVSSEEKMAALTLAIIVLGANLYGFLKAGRPEKLGYPGAVELAAFSLPGADAAAAEFQEAATPKDPGEEQRIFVHVAGAVEAPGVYSLAEGSRIIDALNEAGGPAPGAEIHVLNLAQRVRDGDRIYVPTAEEAGAWAQPAPTTQPGRIDLNSADARALETLPGIGPVLAQRIVEHRAAKGGFSNVDEIKEVSGIGDKVLESIRELVYVR